MILRVSLVVKRNKKSSSYTTECTICDDSEAGQSFSASLQTVTATIRILFLTLVIFKTMSGKLIESNSSCYQNKVTRCSVIMKCSRYKSSFQLTASWVSSQNAQMKSSIKSPPPSCAPPNAASQMSHCPHAGFRQAGGRPERSSPHPLLPQLPRDNPCSGVSFLC